MGFLSMMGIPLRLFHRTWSTLLPSNDSRTVLALPVSFFPPLIPLSGNPPGLLMPGSWSSITHNHCNRRQPV